MLKKSISFSKNKYFLEKIKKKNIKNNKLKKRLYFKVFEEKSKEHIAIIKIKNINYKKKEAFFDILLENKTVQSKSISSKYLIEICNLMFKKFEIFKIYSSVSKKNILLINNLKDSGFYNYKYNKETIIMIRNYFLNKLIIGTANFQNNYGIVNRKKISKKNKREIFNLCKKFNISSYDLSDAYNLNFKSINSSIQNNSNIYLKLFYGINKLNLKNINYFKNIFKKKIKFIIIHGFNKIIELIEKKKLKHTIKLLKEFTIGVSIYSPSEIYKTHKFIKFKYLQAPVNIFDQRFINPKIIRFFKKNKIEFCARSIYLQGLLIQNKKFIKNKFPEFYTDFTQFLNYSRNKPENRKKILTHYVFQNKDIDKVVVGFDSSDQLKNLIQILNNFFKLNHKQILKFKNNKTNLIDPRKWINT